MNKIEEILEKNIQNNKWYLLDLLKKDILKAMEEFGKICFKAGRTYHLHNTYEFEHYEDFLKEIEDE